MLTVATLSLLLPPPHGRLVNVRQATWAIAMCAPEGQGDVSAPKQQDLDVDAAAAQAKALLDEEKQRKIDILFGAPPPVEGATNAGQSTANLAYLTSRGDLVGTTDSSELLALDEANDFWPEHLPKDLDSTKDQEMLWVDELSCIGCTWCADVARSTFRMEDNVYGQARVIQQGGDSQDTVDEAIDCCPADCIHHCTRNELEVLEEHRSLGYLDDLLQKFSTRRLMGEGEGGGAAAAQHWRDPIVHQGWRKGEKYVKSRRLRLEDPLLHHSGEKSSMSLIGTGKRVNHAPSPELQDGTVLHPSAPPALDGTTSAVQKEAAHEEAAPPNNTEQEDATGSGPCAPEVDFDPMGGSWS